MINFEKAFSRMSYVERIRSLTDRIDKGLIDFSIPRIEARTPTQASSNFITNKEQGDWAENLVFSAINEYSRNFVAVKYGKSDAVVAGEEGFDDFFASFQEELDEIGKRPDLLLFQKSDFDPQLGLDISRLPHLETYAYVRKAIAGIEVRSSAFLIERYEQYMRHRMQSNSSVALTTKDRILLEFADLLQHPNRLQYKGILESLTPDNLMAADFRLPGWSSSPRLRELNALLKQLKAAIKEIQKRDYLSITPKVEDLKVVLKWVNTFEVPHYYFQVFFDKVFATSFERILDILSNPDLEGEVFSIESDIKNQNKTTIKINAKAGLEVASKVDEPDHESIRKEMERGRLLFYVTFTGGKAYLDLENFCLALGINPKDF
jgi:AccI restriction endonuclease